MGSYNKRISDQSKIKFDPINRELIDSENSELDAKVKSLEENITGSKTATGNPLTVTDAAPVNAVNLSIDLEPIQEGSGEPSPDNIRPISGRSEVAIQRVGKNLVPMTLEGIKSANTDGTWNGNVYTQHNGVVFTVNTNSSGNVLNIHVEGTPSYGSGWLILYKDLLDIGGIILSGCPEGGDINSYALSAFKSNPNIWYPDYGNGVTIPQDVILEQIYIEIKTGFSIPSGGLDFYPMIRFASDTDSTFEPYAGKTYTIQLGQTVYGGQLDITRGNMVVDRGYIASYNGETLPSSWISDRDVYTSGTTPTIGAEVVYELAEPFTIDLTPQQIKLLENTNTITTDYDGDVLSLEYQPNNAFGELLGEVNNIYDSIIEDIYDKIDSLDTRVTALEE